MKKILILGMLFILLLPLSVFAADGCVKGESCIWYAYNVPSSLTDVNISFVLPNINQTQDFQMTSIDSTTYYYNSSFNLKGNVLGCVEASNSTTSQTSCESKEIYTNSATEELNMLAEILDPFLIFLVGILLMAVAMAGDSRSSYIFGIAAGIWYLASATQLVFSGVVITSVFFMLIGVAAIFISIGEITNSDRKE